jgi:hypothetical protein
MKDEYFLELEHDTWFLYRESDNEPFAYTIAESPDINHIFLQMYRDKASRGNGNSMRIG